MKKEVLKSEMLNKLKKGELKFTIFENGNYKVDIYADKECNLNVSILYLNFQVLILDSEGCTRYKFNHDVCPSDEWYNMGIEDFISCHFEGSELNSQSFDEQLKADITNYLDIAYPGGDAEEVTYVSNLWLKLSEKTFKSTEQWNQYIKDNLYWFEGWESLAFKFGRNKNSKIITHYKILSVVSELLSIKNKHI